MFQPKLKNEVMRVADSASRQVGEEERKLSGMRQYMCRWNVCVYMCMHVCVCMCTQVCRCAYTYLAGKRTLSVVVVVVDNRQHLYKLPTYMYLHPFVLLT